MTRSAAIAQTLGLLLALSLQAQALEVESLLDGGPATNRINLAVLGDGYRDVDQAQLSRDAQGLIDALFGFPPYQQYRGLFNAKLVHVISNQAGATNDPPGTTVDTALGAYYGCQGLQRLICLDVATTLQIAAANVPEYTYAIVVVNDTTYGGSGGQVAVVSTNALSNDILHHEFGHTVGQLTDEYSSPYPGFPPCDPAADCPEANATLRTAAPLKWSQWIAGGTPVPTPQGAGYQGIGLFEGCRYETVGVYRPKDDACLMRALGHPFCDVCAEQMVEAFWTHVSPIDSTAPASPLSPPACTAAVLTVATPEVLPKNPDLLWSIDNGPAAAGTSPHSVGPLPAGSHRVTVTAQDSTALVRHDAAGVLEAQFVWDLEVLPCSMDAGPPDAGALDAGPADAGPAATDDGGVSPTLDAGAPNAAHASGCGCTDSGSSGWGLIALLAVVLLARPRHRLE